MAYGHTDDVPNAFVLEAKPTPESSAVLPDIVFLIIHKHANQAN
ncbi:MAG: hypothetical protein ACKVH8_17885 [Pirellulales bacterium]